jgi:hypothetical protein
MSANIPTSVSTSMSANIPTSVSTPTSVSARMKHRRAMLGSTHRRRNARPTAIDAEHPRRPGEALPTVSTDNPTAARPSVGGPMRRRPTVIAATRRCPPSIRRRNNATRRRRDRSPTTGSLKKPIPALNNRSGAPDKTRHEIPRSDRGATNSRDDLSGVPASLSAIGDFRTSGQSAGRWHRAAASLHRHTFVA